MPKTKLLLATYLKLSDGQFYDQIDIIRLNLRLVGGFITSFRAAFFASADDHVTLLCIDLREDRLKNSTAIRSAIAGIYVKVQGMETERTVVTRGVAKGQNLFSAIDAGETAVIFGKYLIHLR